MIKKLEDYISHVKKFTSQDSNEIESFKIEFLGRKGVINDLFSDFKNVPADQKKEYGQKINELKNLTSKKYEDLKLGVKQSSKSTKEDYTKPGFPISSGSTHPITIIKNRIIDIFSKVGFELSEGPEIEDDWHNFTALNLPKDHPARDMQDTFFVDKDIVLRTHTSNVQIHLMEEKDPPLRFIVPGRVYRNESISYKSYCLFHQVEGLFVDKNVSFAQLKGCLEYFVKKMFGSDRKMRWRPSYFPFTEPSAEVDIWDEQRNQWMEILGCGMVDPEVFNSVNYDPKIWRGYAFGMGVERIAMLKYGIEDIRLFYGGDIRFLRQF